MSLPVFVSYYAFVMTVLCVTGFLLKLPGFALTGRSGYITPAISTVDSPVPVSPIRAASAVIIRPARHFHRRTSRAWTTGYVMYHAAIFLVVTGYAASAAVIAVRLLSGHPVMDYVSGALSTDSSPANTLALIFGNAETGPSSFLFGQWSPVFRALTLCELPLAITGNACLLFTVIKSRMGAVRHDLDAASGDIRISGSFSGQHLAVRLVILSIITMEFIGRTGLVPGIVYAHAALAFTLIGMFPFSYLSHIVLAPLALYFAVSRRRRNEVA